MTRSYRALRWGQAWLLAPLFWGLTACDERIVIGIDTPAPTGGQGGTPASGGSTTTGGSPPTTGGAAGDVGTGGTDTGGTGGLVVGDLLWSSGAETLDLSEWTGEGSDNGGTYAWASGNASITTDAPHSGEGAFRFGIDTSIVSPGDTSHGVRLYRKTHDAPAYYGAWFRLDEPHDVSTWWSIMLFNHQVWSDSTEELLASTEELWEVRLVSDPEMRLDVYDHTTTTTVALGPQAAIPTGQWFHLEMFLDPNFEPGAGGGTIRIWLDGALLFERTPVEADPTREIFWVVGNGSDSLSPSECLLDLDDATIATYRVGP